MHYSQQNTKTETGEALNRKTKTKHHTNQNNKTLNNTDTTLTQHESIKQLNIKHESLVWANTIGIEWEIKSMNQLSMPTRCTG